MSALPRAKKRRVESLDQDLRPYKVCIQVRKVEFSSCHFPICLKVGWIKDGVALETRLKNAPKGWTTFKKKLKRIIEPDGEEIFARLVVSQKVGLGTSSVGWANINITTCGLSINQEAQFTAPLQGVINRNGQVTISCVFKPYDNEAGLEHAGSTTASSQRLNIAIAQDDEMTQPLLSFEDVYLHVLRSYPHIFSLDFVLEHNDRVGMIEMTASNTEGMDQSEIEHAHELLLSLNLFQERETPNRYHIPPAAFDLAAFKRTILYYQENPEHLLYRVNHERVEVEDMDIE